MGFHQSQTTLDNTQTGQWLPDQRYVVGIILQAPLNLTINLEHVGLGRLAGPGAVLFLAETKFGCGISHG